MLTINLWNEWKKKEDGNKTTGRCKSLPFKTSIMKTIRRIIKEYKENKNLIPFKTVVLDTGVICQHYRNGKIEVI